MTSCSPWTRLGIRRKFLYGLLVVSLFSFLALAYRHELLATTMLSKVREARHWVARFQGTVPLHSMTSPQVFGERLQRVKDVCAKHPRLDGKVHGVYPHNASGVLYCYVPKAGCTFWKRIFNFVYLKEQGKDIYPSPWHLPRWVVHSNHLKKGYAYDPNKYPTTNFSTRFIVSRDPYSRVLSSYLDKFYMPDFWKLFGRRIVNEPIRQWSVVKGPDFMTRHFDSMASDLALNHTRRTYEETAAAEASRKTGNGTKNAHNCGKWVTFAEFIFAITNGRSLESHWLPVHAICNPCQFKPTHVIHLESFSDDARPVLEQMGLGDVMNDLSHQKQVDIDMESVTEYNFHLFLHRDQMRPQIYQFYKNCITARELAYRIWQNFVWRGYIHPDTQYVVPDANIQNVEMVKKDFLTQMWEARRRGLNDPAAMKMAKVRFQDNIYRTLGAALFQQLTGMFKMDFEFFGYSNSTKYYSTKLFSKEGRT